MDGHGLLFYSKGGGSLPFQFDNRKTKLKYHDILKSVKIQMCFHCLGKTEEAISANEPLTFDLAPLKRHGLITKASNYVYIHTNIPMFL